MLKYFAAAFFASSIATGCPGQDRINLGIEIPATPDLVKALNGEMKVEVTIKLKDDNGPDGLSDQLELSGGFGHFTGYKDIIGPLGSFTKLCLKFTNRDIQNIYSIYKECENISFSKFKDGTQYYDPRKLERPENVFKVERNEIEEKIADKTSSDREMASRSLEVLDYISQKSQAGLDYYDAILIAKLIAKANERKFRLPDIDYFEIGENASQDTSLAIKNLVTSQRTTNNNTFPAKILLDSYLTVDLERYADGQPSFGDAFLDSLLFLARSRIEIAMENRSSGASTIKSFSIFCQKLANTELIAACDAKYDILVEEMTPKIEPLTGPIGRNELSIARKYRESRS